MAVEKPRRKAKGISKLWIVDSGVSRHMTNQRKLYILETIENSATKHAFRTQKILCISTEELWYCCLGYISHTMKEVSNVINGLDGLTKFKGTCKLCIYSKAYYNISKVPMQKIT